MRQLTRDEVRGALEPYRATSSKIRLPRDFDDVRWERLDYYGWKDARSPLRSYIVTELDGRVGGVLVERVTPSQGTYGRLVMCDLCRFSRRFHEVTMFVARRPAEGNKMNFNAIGTLICADLDCADNVHTVLSDDWLRGTPEQAIARRRRELKARVSAFLRSVLY